MSEPRDHHFLPQFYLRLWEDERGEVYGYRRPAAGRPIAPPRRYPPAGIGYLRDLYAIPAADPASKQVLERRVMAPIDNDAARALEAILSVGGKPRELKLAYAWARFLLALVVRTPRQMEWMAESLRSHDEQELIRPDDQAVLLADTAEAEARGRAELLIRFSSSGWLIRYMAAMPWSVLELPEGAEHFVTGDDPLLISNGIGQADSFLMLPIGPRRLFIAAGCKDVIFDFAWQCARLGPSINDAIVRQSDDLVVADRRDLLSFVQQRIQTGAEDGVSGLNRRTWRALGTYRGRDPHLEYVQLLANRPGKSPPPASSALALLWRHPRGWL